MNSHDVTPDPPLTSGQAKLVAELTDDDVKAIDEALLASTSDRWLKVARVVGTAMLDYPCRVASIPDVYYSQRVQKLVSEGRLEYQGNLSYMRYSEVRRPADKET
jgi:hypothetical protein